MTDRASIEQRLARLALPDEFELGTPVGNFSLPRLQSGPPRPAGRISVEAVLPQLGPELEVITLLGRGGMGTVYLAHQRSLAREVAIKTSRVDAPDSARALEAEAIVTGSLEHPGIVPVHQLVEGEDGRPVLVMKRVEGTSWRALLDDPSHTGWTALGIEPPARQAFHLEVLGRVADTLAFAHSRGLVHRDLKPDNVMLGAFGEVYVLDWGAATAVGTRSEELVGTPRYMAPEMVEGGPVDARTDVFLLGATLHYILTGAAPHGGDELAAVMLNAYLAVPPTYDASVDPALAAIALRAMHPDPNARYADAREVSRALREYERYRAARALTRRADARRARLEERLASAPDEAELPTLYALLAECRFGYAEAAREGAHDEAVAAAVHACDRLAVELELVRGDPRAARVALEALVPPPAELVTRIEALEETQARAREEQARMQRIVEAADARATPGMRALWITSSVLSILMFVLWSSARAIFGAAGTLRALGFSCVALLVLLVGLAAAGKSVWAQPFNRRMGLWAVLTMVSIVLHRVVSVILDAPLPQVLAQDMMLFALAFAAASVFTFRGFTTGALVSLAGAFAITLMPEYAPFVFGGVGTGGLVSLPLVTWLRSRRRDGMRRS